MTKLITEEDEARMEMERVLREAMPYYDSDYAGDWTMDKLVAELWEIAHWGNFDAKK